MAAPRRYRIVRADHLPVGAFNTHCVMDRETGMVARDDDGRLAYFPSWGAARDWISVRD